MARIAGSNGEETAARLRKVALRLFAQEGYAAVSMRRIAGKLGIQAGALYNHYPTKQDILLDLMSSHMQGLIKSWEEESRRYKTPLDALNGFIRFHIRYHLDKGDAVFVSYMELRNLEKPNFEKIESYRRLYEGFLRKIIASGKQQGVFQIADVPIASMAVIAMITGLNTWYRASGRLQIDELEEIYLNMVHGMLGLDVASGQKPERIRERHIGQMMGS